MVAVLDCIHMIVEQFENGRNLTIANSLQSPKDIDVRESVPTYQFCFEGFEIFLIFIVSNCSHDSVFKKVLVSVPFSKFTVFKICRQKCAAFV